MFSLKKTVAFILTLILAIFICSCSKTLTPNSSSNSEISSIEISSGLFSDISSSANPFEVDTAPKPPKLLSQGVYSEYTYDLYEDHVSITGYQGADEYLVIPAEIEGRPVTVLDNFAFCGLSFISKVILPDTLKSIYASVFDSCYSLEHVEIPDSVTYIGSASFHECSALNEINIPPEVTEIDTFAFYGCVNLSEINIPNKVKYIGYGAFANCTSLNNISISNSVAEIGAFVFNNTPWFDSLTDNFVVVGDGVLIDYNGKDSQVTIPDNVKYISSAFDVNDVVNSIILPESVIIIGENAFSKCSSLKSVNVPNSVTAIYNDAFRSTNIVSLIIPDSVKEIGDGAFSNCGELRSIKLPNGLVKIERMVLSGCQSLEEIVIPKTVTSIGEYAFSGCSLITNISLSGTIETIGNDAFSYCSSLETIDLPSSLNEISDNCFAHCSSLRYLSLPNGIKHIGNSAFWGCENLRSIILNEGVEQIDSNAFLGCDSLVGIFVPKSVKSFEYDTWDSVKRILCESNTYIEQYAKEAELNYSIMPNNFVSREIKGEYEYTFFTNYVQVSRYVGTAENSEIPENINGFPVTSIGDLAFIGSRLNTLIIPDQINTISENAFGYFPTIHLICGINSVAAQYAKDYQMSYSSK